MLTKYASMPIAGMRVSSWHARKKLKNIPAIILSVLMAGRCDYCAGGKGVRPAAVIVLLVGRIA